MIIDCISDLHGHYPELPGGDLLIVAGDLTARDEKKEYDDFWRWTCYQKYRKVLVIGGNHDNYLVKNPDFLKDAGDHIEYLCDSMTTFEGVTIWGTPWTPWFHGVNPRCKAFMANESKLKEKFDLIPDKIDILISHGPPKGCLDGCQNWDTGKIEHVGSQSLQDAVDRVQPLYHVFGHIHEHGGKRMTYKWMMDKRADCQMYNVSHVDERYVPKNGATRIEIKQINLSNREDKPLDVKESL